MLMYIASRTLELLRCLQHDYLLKVERDQRQSTVSRISETCSNSVLFSEHPLENAKSLVATHRCLHCSGDSRLRREERQTNMFSNCPVINSSKSGSLSVSYISKNIHQQVHVYRQQQVQTSNDALHELDRIFKNQQTRATSLKNIRAHGQTNRCDDQSALTARVL